MVEEEKEIFSQKSQATIRKWEQMAREILQADPDCAGAVIKFTNKIHISSISKSGLDRRSSISKSGLDMQADSDIGELTPIIRELRGADDIKDLIRKFPGSNIQVMSANVFLQEPGNYNQEIIFVLLLNISIDGTQFLQGPFHYKSKIYPILHVTQDKRYVLPDDNQYLERCDKYFFKKSYYSEKNLLFVTFIMMAIKNDKNALPTTIIYKIAKRIEEGYPNEFSHAFQQNNIRHLMQVIQQQYKNQKTRKKLWNVICPNALFMPDSTTHNIPIISHLIKLLLPKITDFSKVMQDTGVPSLKNNELLIMYASEAGIHNSYLLNGLKLISLLINIFYWIKENEARSNTTAESIQYPISVSQIIPTLMMLLPNSRIYLEILRDRKSSTQEFRFTLMLSHDGTLFNFEHISEKEQSRHYKEKIPVRKFILCRSDEYGSLKLLYENCATRHLVHKIKHCLSFQETLTQAQSNPLVKKPLSTTDPVREKQANRHNESCDTKATLTMVQLIEKQIGEINNYADGEYSYFPPNCNAQNRDPSQQTQQTITYEDHRYGLKQIFPQTGNPETKLTLYLRRQNIYSEETYVLSH